jgi:tripartite ATP-independent transporter DctM subunit
VDTPFILFGVFAILLMFGVPIAFAMAVAAAAVVLYEGLPAVVVMQRILFGVDSFPLLAVPLFLLAGELMEVGGITQRLIAFANSFVGHLRGGLAHVAVAVNMVMSGISGSGTADAAASGTVLIPAMQRRGYSPAFAAAVCGASAVLGPIIPPVSL